MDEHQLALAREVDELLHQRNVGDRRRGVVRKRAEQHSRPRLRRLPGLVHAREEVRVRTDGNALHGGACEAGCEEMDRVARARHERDVTGPEQHPEQVDEALLRAEAKCRLGVGVELDPEAIAIELADRRPEIREAAARRVAVVAWEQRRLPQLLDGDLRRRDVGIAEAEVDHVLTGAAQLELEALDLGECVWG